MPPFNALSWKDLIRSQATDVEFRQPAVEKELTVVEQALGIALPKQLREVLLETNGVVDEYGGRAVLAAADILQSNREFRTTQDFRELYMPF